jgi:hypothetical protein
LSKEIPDWLDVWQSVQIAVKEPLTSPAITE